MQRICPSAFVNCLFSLFPFLKKKVLPAHSELEQEQFSFTPTPKPVPIVVQPPLDTLSVKIDLRSDSGKQEESHLLSNQELPTIGGYSFELKLQPYDKYYSILEGAIGNAQSLRKLFESQRRVVVEKKEKSRVKIGELDSLVRYKMVIEYVLPCTYSFYNRVSKDPEVTTRCNPAIASYSLLESSRPNLTLNELRFKKFMLLEHRCFRYAKYENSSSQRQHWEVCVSVRAPPEADPSEKQCELMAISCLQEHGSQLVVHTYLQVDLKSNIRASKVVLRVYNQVASYIDNLYDYVLVHYQSQDV